MAGPLPWSWWPPPIQVVPALLQTLHDPSGDRRSARTRTVLMVTVPQDHCPAPPAGPSRKTSVYSLNHLVLASNLRYVSNTFLLYQLFVERGEKIFSNCMKDIHLLHLLALNQKFYLSCSLVSQSVHEYKIDNHLCKVNYMHGLKTASVQKEFQ